MTQEPQGEWIEWSGGTTKPPVARDTIVEVRCVGSALPLEPAPASMFRWSRANRCQSPDANIIAYRVVTA